MGRKVKEIADLDLKDLIKDLIRPIVMSGWLLCLLVYGPDRGRQGL